MHSSTSIDIRLRNIIVVGFISTSPSEIVGNSSGKPPADHTPRFTASAPWSRWALQLVSSDHEFAMPITGRPSKTTSLKPSAFSQERCTNPSRSERPNQLRLRSEWDVMAPSETRSLHRNRQRRPDQLHLPSGCDVMSSLQKYPCHKETPCGWPARLRS